MGSIVLVEREMTDAEFARMNAGFDEHTLQFGNPIETEERFGFVAHDHDSGAFIGCSSGLASKHAGGYSNWFYLSDLFVEAPYRGQGIGRELLTRLEARIRPVGVAYIYTWTAGYEAPGFYKRLGYQTFGELPNWYASGHARIGLWKAL